MLGFPMYTFELEPLRFKAQETTCVPLGDGSKINLAIDPIWSVSDSHSKVAYGYLVNMIRLCVTQVYKWIIAGRTSIDSLIPQVI